MGVEEEEMGDYSMQCRNHPYNKTSSQGGICALCLQEKLGKLVSSSLFPSSPSPSFRSDFSDPKTGSDGHYQERSRIPFPLTKTKKKDPPNNTNNKQESNIIFKRSKSTAIPQKRRFWSFFYSSSATKIQNPNISNSSFPTLETPPNFNRKVSRSRSVGCGSKSFSNDLLDRISTGFGDCTLRRVESHREAKNFRSGKNRVKCGGLFGGFAVISSSPSSGSSSYLMSSSTDDNNENLKPVKTPTAVRPPSGHRRNKSWGWAFASPIAFTNKPSTKKETSSPNLSAIPSLLNVMT